MNKVQHFEIPADDVGRARKFYESVFDWKTQDWPMDDGSNYVGLHTGPVDEKNMWKEAGFINGGMFERRKDFPANGPTIAVTVDDINQTLEKIKNSGGTVLSEVMKVAEMGLYAYVKDTEGNVVGVWQNLSTNDRKAS